MEAGGGGDLFGASLKVLFLSQEEEKYDPGQVCNGLLSWGTSLHGCVNTVQYYNGGGLESSGGGVSFLAYNLSCSHILKLRPPMVLSLGSVVPTDTKNFPTERRYCSTVSF